jgi:hypothetical protein
MLVGLRWVGGWVLLGWVGSSAFGCCADLLGTYLLVGGVNCKFAGEGAELGAMLGLLAMHVCLTVQLGHSLPATFPCLQHPNSRPSLLFPPSLPPPPLLLLPAALPHPVATGGSGEAH